MSFVVVLPLLAGCHGGLQVKTDSRVTVNAPPVANAGPVFQTALCGNPAAAAKVAVVDVDGILLNMDMTGFYSLGENPVSLFREKLDAVAADPCIHAVVLRINSPGGGVTATDIMWHDLKAFKARTGLPVVACMMDVGTGGAYYLATAADHITAHPTTVTGGMGVILNLYNMQDSMAQFNVLGTPIKSGEHVDIGTPIHPMAPEARKLLQDMADEYHLRFRRIVEEARPARNPQQVDDFDGRVFTAQQALDRRLIDGIGYLDDAVGTACQMACLDGARTVLLHRANDPVRTPYALTPNVPLQTTMLPLSIPGFERSKLPTFLYLWQPEPTMERLGGR
ncbi:MAG: S49 family peptidase [Pirellulales bacterium]